MLRNYIKYAMEKFNTTNELSKTIHIFGNSPTNDQNFGVTDKISIQPTNIGPTKPPRITKGHIGI